MISIAVLGIDPGTKGGLALLNYYGGVVMLKAFRPDMKRIEFVAILKEAVFELKEQNSSVCFLEKVGVMPTDGKKGAFTFGSVDGAIEATLMTLDIVPKRVYPAMWQSALNCLSRGNKNVTKNKALELYPVLPYGMKITHATADALLIAHFGWLRLAL